MPFTDPFSNTPPGTITPSRGAAFDNTSASGSTPGRGAAFDNTAPAFSAPTHGTAFSNTAPSAATITRAAAFDNTAPGITPTGTENFTAKAQTTASVTVSTLIIGAAVDGVTLASGDLVLVASQGTASQNGLYRVTAGAPVRATDHGYPFSVRVGNSGNVNKGKAYAYFPVLNYVTDTSGVTFTALVATV